MKKRPGLAHFLKKTFFCMVSVILNLQPKGRHLTWARSHPLRQSSTCSSPRRGGRPGRGPWGARRRGSSSRSIGSRCSRCRRTATSGWWSQSPEWRACTVQLKWNVFYFKIVIIRTFLWYIFFIAFSHTFFTGVWFTVNCFQAGIWGHLWHK